MNPPLRIRIVFTPGLLGLLGLLGVLAGTLNGCAKDKTADEWRDEQARKELQKLEDARGSYSGNVRSKSTGAVIASARLDLTPASDVLEGGNGASPAVRSVLVGSLQVRWLAGEESNTAARSATLVFPAAKYEPTTGRYVAARTNVGLAARTVDLSGSLTGRAFVGELSERGLYTDGALLELSKDTTSTPGFAEGSDTARGVPAVHSPTRAVYESIAIRSSDRSSQYRLIIDNNRGSSEDELLGLISPIQVALGSLIFVENDRPQSTVLFSPLIVDLRAGTLRGRVDFTGINSDAAYADLNCTRLGYYPDPEWSCRYFRSRDGGEFPFELARYESTSHAGVD